MEIQAPQFVVGFINDGEAHPEEPVWTFIRYGTAQFSGRIPATYYVAHWSRTDPTQWVEKRLPAAVRAYANCREVGPAYGQGCVEIVRKGSPTDEGLAILTVEE